MCLDSLVFDKIIANFVQNSTNQHLISRFRHFYYTLSQKSRVVEIVEAAREVKKILAKWLHSPYASDWIHNAIQHLQFIDGKTLGLSHQKRMFIAFFFQNICSLIIQTRQLPFMWIKLRFHSIFTCVQNLNRSKNQFLNPDTENSSQIINNQNIFSHFHLILMKVNS